MMKTFKFKLEKHTGKLIALHAWIGTVIEKHPEYDDLPDGEAGLLALIRAYDQHRIMLKLAHENIGELLGIEVVPEETEDEYDPNDSAHLDIIGK